MNLILDGEELPLIVRGNLTVKGDIVNEQSWSGPFLIVTGNVEAMIDHLRAGRSPLK